MIISAVFLLSAGSLAVYHIRLSCANITTREDMKHGAGGPDAPSPYRRPARCADFCAVVCGPDWSGHAGADGDDGDAAVLHSDSDVSSMSVDGEAESLV